MRAKYRPERTERRKREDAQLEALGKESMSKTQDKPHADQIAKLPVGQWVKNIIDLHTQGLPSVPAGSFGVVKWHCEDGRAGVQFECDHTVHTFHEWEHFIKPCKRPKQTPMEAEIAEMEKQCTVATTKCVEIRAEIERLKEEEAKAIRRRDAIRSQIEAKKWTLLKD
jgi:hypothetical protein